MTCSSALKLFISTYLTCRYAGLDIESYAYGTALSADQLRVSALARSAILQNQQASRIHLEILEIYYK